MRNIPSFSISVPVSQNLSQSNVSNGGCKVLKVIAQIALRAILVFTSACLAAVIFPAAYHFIAIPVAVVGSISFLIFFKNTFSSNTPVLPQSTRDISSHFQVIPPLDLPAIPRRVPQIVGNIIEGNIRVPTWLSQISRNTSFFYSLSLTLSTMRSANLLTQTNFDMLVQNLRTCNESEPIRFEQPFFLIQSSNLLNQTNFDALMQNAQYVNRERLSANLQAMQNEHFLTQDNFNLLMQNAQRHINLYEIMPTLTRTGLLNQTNFDALMQNATNANYLHLCIEQLEEVDLLTQANFDTLLQNAQHVLSFQCSMWKIREANLLTQENFDALMQNAQHTPNFDITLVYMGFAHLLNQTNLNRLMEQIALTPHLKKVLKLMHREHILNQTNFDIVMDNSDCISELEMALVNLSSTTSIQNNFKIIINNKELIRHFNLSCLNMNIAEILSEQNLDKFLQNIQYAASLDELLRRLSNRRILNQVNLDFLYEYVNYIEKFRELPDPLTRAAFDDLLPSIRNQIAANIPQETTSALDIKKMITGYVL